MSDSKFVVDVTEQNYPEVVLEGSHSVPVLVDFWAPWCQPCKALTPVLVNLAEAYRGKFILAKINTEEQQGLAAQFAIRSIPTVKLFVDGQPVDEFMGALPESQITAFLDRHLPRESDGLVAQARQLLQDGRVEDAETLVEQARRDDPGNPRVQLAHARLQATLGNLDAAEQALATLPLEEQDKPEITGLRARLVFDRAVEDADDEAALSQRLLANPGDSEAIYQLAAYRVLHGDYQAALEQLLQLMLKDRAYGDDAARKGMLAVFELLGGSGDLVVRYRSRMFNALH